MFFIPAEETQVQHLFDIFSEAALNNPDDEEEDEEEDEEGAGGGGGEFPSGFIYNVDEVQAGAQQAKLQQWESVFSLPGGDRDDATRMGDDGNGDDDGDDNSDGNGDDKDML